MELNFKYSHIYEGQLNPEGEFLSSEKVNEYKEAMYDFWGTNGTKIEEKLRKITGLSFKEETFPVYLNSKKTFSDPLTLKVEDYQDMWDNLVHELIHVVMTQNKVEDLEGWKTLMGKLKDYKQVVKVHVVVHAVHLILAEELFPERIDRIMSYSTFSTYQKSWELVKEMGAQNIVLEVFV